MSSCGRSLLGYGLEDGLYEHDLVHQMPVSDHVLTQDLNDNFLVAAVVDSVEGPEVLPAAESRLANVNENPDLVE